MPQNASATQFKVEIASHADDLGEDALGLFLANERRSVQCGADWFSLLARHVLDDTHSARWLTLKRDSDCLAVWPVQTGQAVQSAGAMSNFYTAIYTPAHAADVPSGGLEALARALRSGPTRAGIQIFAPLDPESAEFAAVESALKQAGFITFRFFRFVNWYLPCAGMSWSRYFDERKGAVRNTVRRMGKKLAADGGVLEVITGGERLAIGIAAYEQVYAASWKQAEPFPDFVRDLMRLCAERGWLRLGVAWLGAKAIAVQFWIVAHGRAEIFKVAYDEAYKSHTAGTLLTALLMEQVLDKDQVREVDYLIGDDPYKKTWMSHRRERWGIAAFDPTTIAGLIGLGRHMAGEFKRRWWQRRAVGAAV
jgi:hypothetical protein